MSENNQTNSNRGGARKGAGRKAGSTTKKTREVADKASSEGITPLEYMLQVMRAEEMPTEDVRDMLSQRAMKFEAAKAAAPYMHPRLASLTNKIEDVNVIHSGAIEHRGVSEIGSRIADLLGDGAAGDRPASMPH